MTKSGRTDIRKRARLTLEQLAARTKVSKSRLNRWENYEIRLPDAEIALIAAAVLEGINHGPKFATDSEIESFLEREN